ncbi:MAG: sigma-70 family RNA polymerase sigma factor [Nannocystaceae bacterium]
MNEAARLWTLKNRRPGSTTPQRPLRLASNREFSEIYRAHVRFVWRCLRGYGVPDAAVQDAAQEVFLVVHRRLSDYDPTTNMRTWIYSIARRIAANRRRSQLRADQREAAVVVTGADRADPESSLAARRDLARVQAFLDQLDPNSRDVFFLFHVESFTGREIGEMLDMNPHTVNTRLRAVRKGFRIYWGAEAPRTAKRVLGHSG